MVTHSFTPKYYKSDNAASELHQSEIIFIVRTMNAQADVYEWEYCELTDGETSTWKMLRIIYKLNIN